MNAECSSDELLDLESGVTHLRLIDILLRSHHVEKFVNMEASSPIRILNEVYGTDFNLFEGASRPGGKLEITSARGGLATFNLPSVVWGDLGNSTLHSQERADEIPELFKVFLQTRASAVRNFSGWAHRGSSFFERFFQDETYWKVHSKSEPFRGGTFAPKVGRSDGYLKKKFTLTNVATPWEAVWAARLFLDKVCLPNKLFVSASVSQVVKVFLIGPSRDHVYVSEPKPEIEFRPFLESGGGVVCRTTFSVE
jgi:hypothetical protein